MKTERRRLFTEDDVCVVVQKYTTADGDELMRVIARGDESCLVPMLKEGLFGNDVRVYKLVGEPDRLPTKRKRSSVDDLVSAIP